MRVRTNTREGLAECGGVGVFAALKYGDQGPSLRGFRGAMTGSDLLAEWLCALIYSPFFRLLYPCS